jgi:hypothetical protein
MRTQAHPRDYSSGEAPNNYSAWRQRELKRMSPEELLAGFQHQTTIAGVWITKLIGYKENKAGQHCWFIHVPSMIITFYYIGVSYNV